MRNCKCKNKNESGPSFIYYLRKRQLLDVEACSNTMLILKRQEVKQASERSEPEQTAKAPNASYAPYVLFLVTLFVQPTRALENKTGLLSSKK